MEVDGLPVRVVTGVECSTLSIELVAEDELPGLSSDVVNLRSHFLRRVVVNGSESSRDFPSGSKVEATDIALRDAWPLGRES